MDDAALRAASDWYPQGRGDRAVRLLDLLRRYRAAELAMHVRTQEALGVGETDLLALRYLLAAQESGRGVLQRDLARFLGISSPSASGLVDRLEAGGRAERRPHPLDRRATFVVAEPTAEQELLAALGGVHERILAALDRLDADETAAVERFLEGLITAVEPEPDGVQ
jgi:DNA-binding MarR family transcriptional regulator